MWIKEFDLFLFDFDGLLVDTEKLHFLAYQKAFAQVKEPFKYDFVSYCQIAHCKSQAVSSFSPYAQIITKLKKEIYLELIKNEPIAFMPGALDLLYELNKAKKTMCVVTNSSMGSVELIMRKLDELKLIPYWLTKEDYAFAKPHPSGYLKAIELYAKEQDKIIGFEDTPRGIQALSQTKAVPVLIATKDYFGVEEAKNMGAKHFESFVALHSEFVS